MTIAPAKTTHQPPAWSIGEPRLLAGSHDLARVSWPEHLAVHGPLPKATLAQLREQTGRVGLLGRGGAGFPVSRKLAALPRGRTHAVVVNGSESEPLSAKDRILMRTAPHLVLDGALAVAVAARSRTVVVTVHDRDAADSIAAAIRERPDARRVRLDLRRSRFVAGEARAVLRGATGGPAVPTGRRTLPSHRGLDGRPTFLSNAETFAQLGLLLHLGPLAYAERGITAEPGTSLLTLTGAVGRPGVVEVSNGLPLALLLEAAAAAPGAAVLLGGYHGTWVPDGPAPALARPTLQQAGLSLGAGVVAVLSPDSCALGEVATVAAWLAAESAGQCGPCVFGLPSIVRDLVRVLQGDAGGYHDLQRHTGLVTGRGACAHPDGVARFVTSSIRRFGADLDHHLRRGGCGRPVLGQLMTPPSGPPATAPTPRWAS
jgi:NADH:ubiquinone oxidoreductase subunit F (NADH-binding)